MSDIKKIAKSTGIYFAGNVLSKLIAFFLVPLYTNYIDSAAFGYYDMAIAIVQFVQSVLFIDIASTILRFMLDVSEDKNKAIATGLSIFGICLAVYIVVGIFTGVFGKIEYVWFLFAYGAISVMNTVSASICRGNGYSIFYAATGVITTIVYASLNLILIIVVKMGYSSLYIAFIAAQLLQFVLLEIKNKNFRFLSKKYFDKELFYKMLKFALPLSINSVAYWGLASMNRLIISFMLGTGANGYLAIANKFTSVVYLLSTCFQLAWQELAYSKENSLTKNTGEYYSKAFNMLLKIVLIGLALILPAIKILLSVFPSFVGISYSESIELIPLAMAGAIMSVLSAFLGSIFGGIKKTNIIFISTLAGSLVNAGVIVGLLYAGFGVQSANIGFLLGFTVNTLIRTIVLKKYISMKTNYIYLIVFIPLYIGISFVFLKSLWYWNLLLAFLILILTLILYRKEFKIIINGLIPKVMKKRAPEKIEIKSEKYDGEEFFDEIHKDK